jgi:hypothetical protein
MNQFDLRQLAVTVLRWAATAFHPGTAKRTAADGLLDKLEHLAVSLVAGEDDEAGVADLAAYATAACALNSFRYRMPGGTIGDVPPAAIGCLGGAYPFLSSRRVTHDQIRWVLSGLAAQDGTDLGSMVRHLLHTMENQETVAAA